MPESSAARIHGNIKGRSAQEALYCSDKGMALYRRVSPSRMQFHGSLTAMLGPEQARQMEAAMLTLARQCVDELEGEPTTGARRGRTAALK